jgi:hypothetical protein
VSQDKTTEVSDVTGHLIRLDATRLVFLGESPAKPDTYFLGFRNAEGNDTKIMFSREAVAALVKLATEPLKGERVEFPHKMEWRVVTEGRQ